MVPLEKEKKSAATLQHYRLQQKKSTYMNIKSQLLQHWNILENQSWNILGQLQCVPKSNWSHWKPNFAHCDSRMVDVRTQISTERCQHSSYRTMVSFDLRCQKSELVEHTTGAGLRNIFLCNTHIYSTCNIQKSLLQQHLIYIVILF